MAAVGASHLSGGRVNVGLLRECARRELLQRLNKQPGSKVMSHFNSFFEQVVFHDCYLRISPRACLAVQLSSNTNKYKVFLNGNTLLITH